MNQNRGGDSTCRLLGAKWIYTRKHGDILTPPKFVRRGMIKGMMKAGYHGKEDRGLEGFYGIGDSYPKKLCWGKASKWDCCWESDPLFRVAKASHDQLTPICLSEEIRKPFVLSCVFFLSSGEKSILLVKKKAPSRSGFPLSTYVV